MQKNLKKKNVCHVIIEKGRAVNILGKEAYLYSNGVICVVYNDGKKCIYSTKKNLQSSLRFQFYVKEGEEQVLSIAGEETLENKWQTIFVFLFDEDGGLLLYTDRDSLAQIGMRYSTAARYNLVELWKEAINVAAIISKELLTTIERLRSSQNCNDLLFLEDVAYGK